jgi:subtilisin family serine protease
MFLLAAPAQADTRVIVRVLGGLPVLQPLCRLLGCSVQYGLGDDQGEVFLITVPSLLDLRLLVSIPGVLDVEIDQTGRATDPPQSGAPPALYDSQPVNYYGTTVRHGYVEHAHGMFNVKGAGIVAVIDTGVDSTHPVLANVLVPGYDFTRNQPGIADEKADVTQSTTAVIDQSTTAVVDQSTTAVIDGRRVATLNQPQYEGFGHGTMVSGVVHLVAPGALIMPLKAFHVDGTGYASDVIRAINYAVANHARILNMSFSFPSASTELETALTAANQKGVIAVAAAGNDGKQTLVYPAAYTNLAMGVASTTNYDTQSSFTNYGDALVWIAAPGEGVVTLYPYSTYAATWGTSFSTPMAAGAAALILDMQSRCTEPQAARALANAKYINAYLGNGRLDLVRALAAWKLSLGLL